MNTKQLNNEVNEDIKQETADTKRRRRHWYDHEKLNIIQAYDKGDLEAAPGKPNFVIDPKSKETLSIFLIESWKDSFRTLGLIKKGKQVVEKPVAVSNVTQNIPANRDTMQSLLLDALLENKMLKEQLRNKNSKSTAQMQ